MRLARIILFSTLSVLTILRCFYFDWYRPVERWDEATNISVINGTIRHNSVAVLWNNNRLFFEKPPVWFSVGTFLAINSPIPHIITLRLFSAFSGMFLISIVCIFANNTWGLFAGITAWFVMISTNHLFTSNIPGIFSTHTLQSADGDALFMLFILLSGVLSLRIQNSVIASIGTGIFTGLALLTKSPLGCIPLVVETVLICRSKEYYGYKNIFTAWCVALVIFCFWFVPMAIWYKSDFLHEYVNYHIVKRVITPIERHTGSIWFYILLVFSKQVFLFMEIYVISTISILRSKKLFQDRTLVYVLYCSIGFLLIPTLIQTKLSWYMFPFYPFAALTISGALSHYLNFSRFSDKRV